MKISKEHVIYSMDAKNEPIATCKNGETLVFECLDCFSNQLKTHHDKLDGIDMNHINPATGPVYVLGAKPGDALCVTIRDIEIPEVGTIVAEPNFGRLGHKIKESQTLRTHIYDQKLIDFEGHILPLKKMIGVIGTAPADQAVNTGTPGAHGGNMDTIHITEGSKVYLPVNVEGALLAMGDCHATMGDGEIIGAGLEIPANVTVTVEILRDFDLPLPMVETEDLWMTIASAPTMEAASDQAIENMLEVIRHTTDLDLNQAAMLLSLAGNLRVSQIVNPQVTMRMEIAKTALK